MKCITNISGTLTEEHEKQKQLFVNTVRTSQTIFLNPIFQNLNVETKGSQRIVLWNFDT